MKRETGFSLVELMIVVAIMAILAAIAIPSFMRFSMKAKTSEATTNLAAIRTCEESYRSENDVYLACPLSPAGGGTDSAPDAWTGGGVAEFADIGFSADGNVRYIYQVIINADENRFAITAESDLDEANGPARYTVSNDEVGFPLPQAQFPKPWKDPAMDDF